MEERLGGVRSTDGKLYRGSERVTQLTHLQIRINLGKQIVGSRTKRRSSTNINSFHHLFTPSALIMQNFYFPRLLS